jgi:hypothetical protein
MNRKLTLKLSPDLRRRLAMESADTGKSNSQVVAELVNANLQLPDEAKQYAADLQKMPSAQNAKAVDRQGKNTSLYLPVSTLMRLHFHTLKTGEDRMSTVIGLITEHIPPCGRYDPRTHATYDWRTHHAHEGRSRSMAYANNTGKRGKRVRKAG